MFNNILQALGGGGGGGGHKNLCSSQKLPPNSSLKTQRNLFPPEDTDDPILGLWLMNYCFNI